MLDRLEVLGLVEDCRVEDLLADLFVDLDGGLAACLLEGREALMEDLDMDPLEARCPMRWASSSRGVKKRNKSAAKASFNKEDVHLNIRHCL